MNNPIDYNTMTARVSHYETGEEIRIPLETWNDLHLLYLRNAEEKLKSKWRRLIDWIKTGERFEIHYGFDFMHPKAYEIMHKAHDNALMQKKKDWYE